MSEESASILTTALRLSSQDRAELAAALWESLDAESELAGTTDDDLIEESRRRRADLLENKVSPITHQELRRQLGR